MSGTQFPFTLNIPPLLSYLTLFLEVAFSEYVSLACRLLRLEILHLGMHELLSNVNAVHPWLTMPHSPQHLFKLFTYNLTSGLQQLPPSLCCQHVLFYSWPAHLRSAAAQCAWCPGQYRFSGLRETQQLYHSQSPPLWLSSRLHTSLQLYPLFICFHVRLIDFFLPCSYLFVFLF